MRVGIHDNERTQHVSTDRAELYSRDKLKNEPF